MRRAVTAILFSMLLFMQISTMVSSTGSVDVSEQEFPIEVEMETYSPGSFHFTENLGQWDANILFIGETSFGRIGLGKGKVYFDIFEETGKSGPVDHRPDANILDNDGRTGMMIVYHFVGSKDITPQGLKPLPHKTNYFKGRDPSRWVTDARSYSEVIYEDLWEGIDLVYHFDANGLKYDLLLEPYARTRDIRIKLEGHDRIRTDRLSMEVVSGVHTLIDDELYTYYGDSPEEEIDSKFIMISDDTFGFELNDHQVGREVVIDPVIRSSTYIGGSESDRGYQTVIDPDGDIYLIGSTRSTNFPTTSGSYDTSYADGSDFFVSKFDQDLDRLLFSTYIGGSGYEGGYTYEAYMSMVEDGILVSGLTSSSDFPTTENCYDDSLGGYYDSFFLKLNLSGSDLLFSSYFGGSGNYDRVRGMMASSDGGFYLCGSTSSSDFPTTAGAYMTSLSGNGDGFVSKFNSDGDSLMISTFIGGSSYIDYINEFVFDENGDLLLTGQTYSTDFPTTSNAYDRTHAGSYELFVTRMKKDLSGITDSTYIGGDSYEYVYDIVVDADGHIIIAGQTYSDGFPTTNGTLDTELDGYNDGYVSVFDSNLSELLFSTFFGGGSRDSVNGLGVDSFGNIVIAGYTSSDDIRTTEDAEDDSFNGDQDLFLSILNRNLSGIEYSTYIGGAMNDTLNHMSVDQTGKAIFTGYTDSDDFPVTSGSYQTTHSGSGDAFVFSIPLIPWLEPSSVISVKAYSGPSFFREEDRFDIGSLIYLEINGVDANTSLRSGARLNVEFPGSSQTGGHITLLETELDSGTHRGSFRVPQNMNYFDLIRFSSWKDPTKNLLVTVDYPDRPASIDTVSVLNLRTDVDPIDRFDLEQTVFLRTAGSDSSPTSIDRSFLNVTSDRDSVFDNPLVLMETGFNTGVFLAEFKVSADLDYFENLTFTSVESPGMDHTVMVHTPVQIRPLEDVTTAMEDEEYRVEYRNFGYEAATWDVSFTSEWLRWDEEELVLHGTPRNDHIYPVDVSISIEDGLGHFDEHDFRINVENTPPEITTENVLTVTEGESYYVDYNSTDDGLGEISWSVIPDNLWFTIDENDGILSGTPKYDDSGTFNITVSVNDGNGGTGSTSFMLTVLNKNQAPSITTLDITNGRQGERYYMRYEAQDPDGDLDLHWELRTDAPFLTMNNETGELSGTPGMWDVGAWTVNISVTDPEGLSHYHEFILTIENVNDRPLWSNVPEDVEVLHGTLFSFDVNASDPDPGDEIEFSLRTEPETDIGIDPSTGQLSWMADYTVVPVDGRELEVVVKVTDSAGSFSTHTFGIRVTPTLSPTSDILGPGEGEKTSSSTLVLSWSGADPESEPITYRVYLSTDRPQVEMLREEALYMDDLDGTTMTISDLEEGTNYYWTVVPYDRCTFGNCLDDVMMFRTNNIPTIPGIPLQRTTAGEEIDFKIAGTDKDADDAGALTYALLEGPDGLTVSGSGAVNWKPGDGQVGVHTIVVSVSDGLESSTGTLDIEVTEAESGGPLMIYIGMIILGLLFIIIIILQILILTRKKPAKGDEELDEEEMKKDIRETVKEMADDLEKLEMKEEPEGVGSGPEPPGEMEGQPDEGELSPP